MEVGGETMWVKPRYKELSMCAEVTAYTYTK
jgi:coenzyme PQQ precursor peptide PqqA